MWDSKQVALRVSQGTLEDIDSDSLWPVEEHTASCGAPATPFSAGEIAYFKSAAYIAQRFHDCGKDIYRPVPALSTPCWQCWVPTRLLRCLRGVIPGVALPL